MLKKTIIVFVIALLAIPSVFSEMADLSSGVPRESWSSSSSLPQREHYRLADGTWNQNGMDEDTWVAVGNPNWAKVDLNNTYHVSSIFINDGAYTDEINREPCSFSVESSTDGTSWKKQFLLADSDIKNWNDDAPTSINKSVDFDARYIRIADASSGICGGDETGVRIGEMIVYGDNVPVSSSFFKSAVFYFLSAIAGILVLSLVIYFRALKKK